MDFRAAAFPPYTSAIWVHFACPQMVPQISVCHLDECTTALIITDLYVLDRRTNLQASYMDKSFFTQRQAQYEDGNHFGSPI